MSGPQPSRTKEDVENLLQSRRQTAPNPSPRKKRGLSVRDDADPSLTSVQHRQGSPTRAHAKKLSPIRDSTGIADKTQAAPLSPSSKMLFCTESPSEVFEQTRGSNGVATWRLIRICTEQGWETRQHDFLIRDSDLDETQNAPLSPSSKLLHCSESPSEVFAQTRGSKGAASWPHTRVCTERGWEPSLPAHQQMIAGQRYRIHAGAPFSRPSSECGVQAVGGWGLRQSRKKGRDSGSVGMSRPSLGAASHRPWTSAAVLTRRACARAAGPSRPTPSPRRPSASRAWPVESRPAASSWLPRARDWRRVLAPPGPAAPSPARWAAGRGFPASFRPRGAQRRRVRKA